MENINNSVVQGASNPWQDRGSIGFFKAIFETIKYVLLKPGEFFDNLEIQNSVKDPYLFYIIVTACASLIAVAVELLFKPGSGSIFIFILSGIFVILIPLIAIYIGAAVLHLGVMIVGGNGGFKGTFNVLAYNASTSIFLVIPFIGGLISGIWSIIVGVKGFKRVHNLSTIRAVIAYFGLFFIVALIGLLAAIAIPNLLRARGTANEALAKATARVISTALETYATANSGQYPIVEHSLVGGENALLPQTYDNKVIAGYKYSINLDTGSYRIIVKPESCGTSGVKTYTIDTGGVMQESNCK